jgi:rhamnosyltransferase
VKNPPNPDSHGEPRIWAVVVTYFPDADVIENLRKLAAQVSPVVVVDNGSQGPSTTVVDEIGRLSGIQLIRNTANLGIGAALNTGIRRALDNGAEWVVTFDQDSAIGEGFFSGFFQALKACPTPDKVGMIVPGCWAYDAISSESKTKASDASYAFVIGAPTSGSLIKAEVFAAIGFCDESLFIDYVDTDLCLRLRKKGFRILSARHVMLRHELGENQTRNIMGFKLSFRIHKAWRYYYIMRNRVILYRRYAFRFMGWALWDALWVFLELGRMACLEDDRKAKLRLALTGIFHGLCGRTGRHPEFPKQR